MIAAMARACSTGPDADEREGVLSDSSAASSGSLQNPMVFSIYSNPAGRKKRDHGPTSLTKPAPTKKKRHSARAAYCACTLNCNKILWCCDIR